MKYIYSILFFTFSFALIQAQIVTIPDANFKHILTTDNCVDLDDDGIGDADADTNNDGEIQVAEAEAVEYLILDSATPNMRIILDVTGLDAFVNLKSFNSENIRFHDFQNIGGNFQYVGVNALDFSPFSNLEVIRISDEFSSVLTSINASGLTNLTDFSAFWVRPEDSFEENQIPVNIDLQGCTSLVYLNFANSLVDIDFCQVPSLETVICWELYPSNINLDFNCLINLKNLDVSLNFLNSLYLKNGSVLETLSSFSTFGNFLCIDNNQDEFDNIGGLLDSFDHVTTTCETPLGNNLVSGAILANTSTTNATCELNTSLPGPLRFKLIQNNTTVLNVLSNTTDSYELPVGEGDYQVSASTSFSDGFNVVPSQFDVSFSEDNGEVFMQDICMEPRVEVVDGIEIKFYPHYYNPDPLINRFDAYMVLTNTNNTDYTGDLRLEFDGDYTSPFDYDYFPDSELADEVIWNNLNIPANGYLPIWLRVGYNSDTDPNYPLFAGDNLIFDLFLTEITGGDTLNTENDTPSFRLIQTIDATDQVLNNEEFNPASDVSIKLYPNPSRGLLYVKHKEVIKNISIVSLNGQLVNFKKYSQHNSNTLELDISLLDEGLYFAIIQTESTVFTKKIIKN